MRPAIPAPIRQGSPTVDDLDLFRAYCPDPGEPPAGHRDAVVRSLIQGRPGVRRPARRRGVLVGAMAAVVALVLAGAIVVHRSGSSTADTAALGPVVVRLDDHLGFVSDEGWDARLGTGLLPTSDGRTVAVPALQIANFTLPPGMAGERSWSTEVSRVHGDQVLIRILRIGPTPPDAVLDSHTHRGLPMQVAASELSTNGGGIVQVWVQILLVHQGISYRVDIASDASPADTLVRVNRGLAGLRAVEHHAPGRP